MVYDTILPIIKNIYVKLGGEFSDVSNDKTIGEVLFKMADLITPGGGGTLPWTELAEDVDIDDLEDGSYVATDEIVFTYGSGIYDVMGLNAGDIISLVGAQAVILSSYGFIVLQNSSGVWYADEAAMQNEVDTALSGKQDTLNAGQNILINNGTISADNNIYHFVSSLPNTSYIAEDFYCVKADRLFPSASAYVDNTYQKIAVAYDFYDSLTDKSYRLLQLEISNDNAYDASNPKSLHYKIYKIVNNAWTLETEATNRNWASAMKWRTNVVNTKFTNVYYSNCKFTYSGMYAGWSTSMNIADINGMVIDTSLLPPYVWHIYKRNSADTDWEIIGTTDLTELFNSVTVDTEMSDSSTNAVQNKVIKGYVDTELSNKADKSLFFTNISIAAADWVGNTFAVETFEGDGTTTAFTLEGTVASGTPTVKINGTATTAFTYSAGVITFTSAPANEAEIEVTYNVTPDTGFENYIYKAVITGLTGVTSDMYGEVVYYDAQSGTGDYSRTANTGSGSATIYSNNNAAIIIPTIIVGGPNIIEVVQKEGHNYSTNEQVIGTWIDGKPIYEKTIEIENLVKDTNTSFDHNIANIDKVIDYSGAWTTDGQNAFNLNYWYSSSIYTRLYCAREIINYMVKDNNITGGYVTMRYTKTTDTVNN